MLDIKNEWWKYIDIEKFKELISQIPSSVKYITPSPARELALLNKNKDLIGLISISAETMEIF